MPKNVNQYASQAKTWAIAHIVAASLICLVVGLLLGATLS